MKTWHEIAGCSHNVKNTLAHARHNAHIDRYIRRIRNFHADMRYIRARGPMLKGITYMVLPFMQPLYNASMVFFISSGSRPVIDWTRVFLFPEQIKFCPRRGQHPRGLNDNKSYWPFFRIERGEVPACTMIRHSSSYSVCEPSHQ